MRERHSSDSESDWRVVWQALNDARYFYERHGCSGAFQVRQAIQALERLVRGPNPVPVTTLTNHTVRWEQQHNSVPPVG